MKLFSRLPFVTLTRVFLLGSLALTVLEARASEAAKQPIYHDHPLRHWVEVLNLDYCDAYHAAVSAAVTSCSTGTPFPPMPKVADIPNGPEAQKAIRHAGTNALPFLLTWLNQSNSYALSKGIEESLRALGSAARPAIPELVQMATNQVNEDKVEQAKIFLPIPRINLRTSDALMALGAIGPEALPVLVSILTNDVPSGTKVCALEAIGSMGMNAAPAIPDLITCMEDKDEWVARQAVMTIGTAGLRDARVLAVLQDIQLKSKSANVQRAVLSTLHSLGAGTNAVSVEVKNANIP